MLSLLAVDPASTDFHGFYASGFLLRTGRAWADGASVFTPNLNPPTFNTLIAPLTLLPLHAAYYAWNAIGLVSLIASLRRLHRAHPIRAAAWPWIVGAVGLSLPAIQTWTQGQVGWVLLYPVTRAWLSRAEISAGLWLAPVVLIKPPLALMTLLLPVRTWLSAGLVSAAAAAVHIAVVGLPRWRVWLDTAIGAPTIREPANASLLGIAARFQFGLTGEAPVAGLSLAWWGLWVASGLAIARLAYRSDWDKRWLAASFGGVWLNPLGWAYYVVLWLGLILRHARFSWPMAAAVALLTEPILIGLASATRQTPLYVFSLSACAAGVALLAIILWPRADEHA
ncbi:MAG TPA: glycosyltransferase 87 family protein [Vicinamibacterales bacterium]|nr:glycosyltransferase 87 family protein [Vicinamibacterales bacterium]